MAAPIWHLSGVPFIDPNGTPYSGAKVYFYDAGTTTPRTVFQDGNLTVPHDSPVLANGSGRFPQISLPQGDYKYRITDANGVILEEADEVATPITVITESSGTVEAAKLIQTGFIQAYGSANLAGWLPCNGRTIGNAGSGGTERQNADCENLFLHIWNIYPDSSNPVSGGRGASAASDWALNKTIALPDLRGAVLAGLVAMGNADKGNIPSSLVTGNANTVGSTAGAAEHTLTINEMPDHNHGGATGANGGHSHQYTRATNLVASAAGAPTIQNHKEEQVTNTSAVSDHTHTISNQGGGNAHNNMQPTHFTPFIIKL